MKQEENSGLSRGDVEKSINFSDLGGQIVAARIRLEEARGRRLWSGVTSVRRNIVIFQHRELEEGREPSMTLTELLENKFRGDIRFRGSAYLKAERVSITRVTPDHLFGLVRDGVEYETHLSRENGELRMFCNCNTNNRPDAACKHLWATILAVDEGRYLTGAASMSNMPPFAAENDVLTFDDDEWGDDLPGDVFFPPTSGGGKRGSLAVEARLREWESRLQRLRGEMETGSKKTGGTATGGERQIYYEIDVEQSRNARQLVVQTSQRQRRSNGQWGKLKPLKLRPGRLDEVEHQDDCRILAYLSGGTPERTNWHAQQAEFQTSVYRYQIPQELCELILPMMCATGRVRYLDDGNTTGAALEWDDGPPWELCMGVQETGEQNGWCVEGSLHRGDEVLPLSETLLLVPGGMVLTATRISRLEDFGAFHWISLLQEQNALSVPAGEEHELVDCLLDMPILPRLRLPDELRLEEVQCDPVPHLIVHSPKSMRWHRERLQGEVQFDYLGTSISGSSAQWAIVQREQARCLLRNRQLEDQAWSELQELGFRRLLDQRRGGYDVEIAARDLGAAVRQLVARGWVVRADGKQVRQPGQLQFQLKSGIDWFELHGRVDFEGCSVSFPELLSALVRGDSTVRLSDGSWGVVPEEWIKQYGLLAGLGVAEDEHVRFAANQVGILDALLSTQDGVDYDDKFAELRQRFRDFAGIPEAAEPDGFKGRLRTYQREGLGWLKFLQDFRFGGCLADDMGLGKTVQLLALLQDHRRQLKERRPSLIVVPKSLLFNWREECERFTPTLQVAEYTGMERAALRKGLNQYDVVLTTYGTLRRDIVHLKDCKFEYVVLDEAQAIKNAGSQVAKASRLLHANHRLALSGTPIENHLGDLWSIFEFLNPGMLGRSSVFKLNTGETTGEESRKLLAQGLRPFILRRTKAQVASELPEKVEQTIHCRMGKEQRRLYNELREHYRGSLLGMVQDQGLAKSKIHVLEALLRLRQAACHPALLDKTSQDESSAKLDVLCPHLEELLDEGHKVLVFSQFTSMLAIVKRHLDVRNITYSYLDGQTRNRKECVDRFQTDPDCGVFLISLKAGGLGLNLTAADYVFLLDPWWNPAVETQAIDRAHRVGQTRRVFAYRLICEDTVEEKIAELQKKKRSLADAILEADGSVLKDLTTEDLEMLLS
jgi:superfamily II DNA or RNA helicase